MSDGRAENYQQLPGYGKLAYSHNPSRNGALLCRRDADSQGRKRLLFREKREYAWVTFSAFFPTEYASDIPASFPNAAPFLRSHRLASVEFPVSVSASAGGVTVSVSGWNYAEDARKCHFGTGLNIATYFRPGKTQIWLNVSGTGWPVNQLYWRDDNGRVVFNARYYDGTGSETDSGGTYQFECGEIRGQQIFSDENRPTATFTWRLLGHCPLCTHQQLNGN